MHFLLNDMICLKRGDCLELMKEIPDKSIDMILCDLPFGQTARNKWDSVIPFDLLWKQYDRIIKDNGAIVLFANGMFTADLIQSNRKMWRYNLVWEKAQPTGFLNANRMPEEAYGCLVTVMDCEAYSMEDFENIYPEFVGWDGENWNDGDGEEISFEVIAWMPLPKPYKEKTE